MPQACNGVLRWTSRLQDHGAATKTTQALDSGYLPDLKRGKMVLQERIEFDHDLYISIT
jgi:hypothetical protein